MSTSSPDVMLQIFKMLGAPLVSASVAHAKSGQGDVKESVQVTAQLLTKAVQGGIDIGAILQLEQQGDQAESGRVAATALSAQLIGGLYASTGSMPEISDLAAITGGLKAVKELTTMFETSPQAALRLQAMAGEGISYDPMQAKLQMMAALAPAMQVIAAKPLGQDSVALSAQIGKALIDKAAQIVPDPQNITERAMALQGIVPIYVGLHEQEAKKPAADINGLLQATMQHVDVTHGLAFDIANDAPSSAPAASPVASAQDNAPVPPPAGQDQGSQPQKPAIFSAPIKPPADTQPPPESIVPPVAPPAQEPPQEPPQAPPPADSPSSTASPANNPMGFFVKKPEGEATPPPPPPPTEAPPPAAPPASPPPQDPPPQDPPQAPPPSVPEQPPQDAAPSGEKPVADKANPMSFFTKKNTDDGGES